MTDQTRTEEEALKPTIGENITELFSRVAKLNDKMAAVLAPEWGARMGIIPEGHPLHPTASCSPGAEETDPNSPAATEATGRPTLRERHRAQWLALTDAERAARIAALDEDDEPEQSARTTPDNPATSSEWTPPPPGDRREQLPDAILTAIRPGPYLSTACHAAFLCETTEPTEELTVWPERLHARCRLQNKFTGKPCVCGCHGSAEPDGTDMTEADIDQAMTDGTPVELAAPPRTDVGTEFVRQITECEADDLTGAWMPDPPIRCLNLGVSPAQCGPHEDGRECPCPPGCGCCKVEATPSQRPELRDDIRAAIRRAPFRELRSEPPNGPLVITALIDDVADAALKVLYREWPWLRAAAEERDQSAALLAAITAEAARRGVISIDGIRNIVKGKRP